MLGWVSLDSEAAISQHSQNGRLPLALIGVEGAYSAYGKACSEYCPFTSIYIFYMVVAYHFLLECMAMHDLFLRLF